MYLHGYSDRESSRLVSQAAFLEPWVYRSVDFRKCERILEIGCGVGAQTLILNRRYPLAKITCVDREDLQLDAFRRNLSSPHSLGQVTVQPAEGEALPFANESFDGVFICWVLEHVKDPKTVLAEAHRVLKTGGKIYATEVANESLFTLPHLPYLHTYFERINLYQRSIGGSPNYGLQAPSTMDDLGFHSLEITPLPILFDSRMRTLEERKAFVGYWESLLKSMEAELLKQGLVTPWMIKRMQEELRSMVTHRPQIFSMTPIQVFGQK